MTEDVKTKREISSKQIVVNFLCVRETRGKVNLEDTDTILRRKLENKKEETWKKIMNVLLEVFEKNDNHPDKKEADEVEYALQKEFETSMSVREGKKYEHTQITFSEQLKFLFSVTIIFMK